METRAETNDKETKTQERKPTKLKISYFKRVKLMNARQDWTTWKKNKNNQYYDTDKTAHPPNIKNILKAKCKYFYTNKLENLQ